MKTSRIFKRPRHIVKSYLRHHAPSCIKRVLTADNMHRLFAEKRRSGGLSSQTVAGFLAKSAKTFIRERLEEEEVLSVIAEMLAKTLTQFIIVGLAPEKSANLDEINHLNESSSLIGDSQVLKDFFQAMLKAASSTDPITLYRSSICLLQSTCQQSLVDIIAKVAQEYSGLESNPQASRHE